jgi:hypothetical protein
MAERIGQGFDRMRVEDCVTGSVDLGVQLTKRERSPGLLEEGEAEGSELSSHDVGGVGGDGGKGCFIGDVASASAPTRGVGGADLVVETLGAVKQCLPARGEIEHLLIELADFVT